MNPALMTVCPVCSLAVKSHDGAARFGDQLMHGACYVKYREAAAIVACDAQDGARDVRAPLGRLVESLRIAVSAEFRQLGQVWTPAFATVSNTVTRTLLFGFALGKLEAVRVFASRLHHS